MSRIYVEFAGLNQISKDCKTVSARIDDIQSDFQYMVRQLDWDVKFQADINQITNQIVRKLDYYKQILLSYQRFIENVYREYVQLDEWKEFNEDSPLIQLDSIASRRIRIIVPAPNPRAVFWEEFISNFGWKEILAGAGDISTIYDLITGIREGKTWKDFIDSGIDVYQFLSGAAKKYNNYKKIGNVVGTKTAMAWWAKSVTGLKPLGRVSTAKNPITRFVNNLTNKTSPFNAQLKGVLDNFKGKNGIGNAVASWGSVAVNGILNAFNNIEEQKNSNGTISTGRVIAETITETAIDTALTYGTGIIVGAAVTTVIGTAAAPGVLVVATSGAIVALANAGVKALTGKATTEWVSDTILDTGEAILATGQAIGSAIGNAAKNVSESIGNWFNKLSFA